MHNMVLTMLVAVTLVAGQIPTNGLLARYDFTSGTLTDGSGNGRTLISYPPKPILTTDRYLQPNNAYLFQGNLSDYFYRVENGLPVGSADRSICFWIALAEKGDSAQQVVAWGAQYSMWDTSTAFRLIFRADTLCVLQKVTRYAKAKITHKDFPAPGNWTAPWAHVALTIENKSAKWYVNGTLLKEVPFPELATSEATNAYLLVNGIGGRYLKGKLDEILIYGRALTATEVARIYKPLVGVIHSTPTKQPYRTAVTEHTYMLDGRLLTVPAYRKFGIARVLTH